MLRSLRYLPISVITVNLRLILESNLMLLWHQLQSGVLFSRWQYKDHTDKHEEYHDEQRQTQKHKHQQLKLPVSRIRVVLFSKRENADDVVASVQTREDEPSEYDDC